MVIHWLNDDSVRQTVQSHCVCIPSPLIPIAFFKNLSFDIAVAGKQIGIIESGVFCKAFFDMYVGDPPVLQSAKEEFGANLARVLSC